jgi:hypothetical protein
VVPVLYSYLVRDRRAAVTPEAAPRAAGAGGLLPDAAPADRE